jgi:lysophospholipase L1-like esterase
MATEHASTDESTDPYCLDPGEAAALLAGHPWRRFVVLGDSVAEGLGDPLPGYYPAGWADRIADELRAVRPELVYRNLGERDLRTAQVRQRQLAAALAFEPDLALVACGGNDALHPRFDPDLVSRELTAIIEPLQQAGAEVVTISVVVVSHYPAFPSWFQPSPSERMRVLAERTNAIAAKLGTVHIDLADHPTGQQPYQELLSEDGLHANARSHAICAAEAIRRLGARLGNTFRVSGQG